MVLAVECDVLDDRTATRIEVAAPDRVHDAVAGEGGGADHGEGLALVAVVGVRVIPGHRRHADPLVGGPQIEPDGRICAVPVPGILGDGVIDLSGGKTSHIGERRWIHDRPAGMGENGKTAVLPDDIHDLLRRRVPDGGKIRVLSAARHTDPEDVPAGTVARQIRVRPAGVPLHAGEQKHILRRQSCAVQHAGAAGFDRDAGLSMIRDRHKIISAAAISRQGGGGICPAVGPRRVHMQISLIPVAVF